ncbi:PASTA domain-containing protein [Falsarthrobacter nasiphocae]|uniref:Beta-lactam-binding protein with PASTA domain n=1 Tax=Falsarthrobacter nasiphocae TaxID=189863 RepID=A0AAE4C851_9MICC|nr:PASTA domain-containing protein [Falsarthrobacter nasiphocae]MDR6892045.1 beta-lactam-binding protein with PASTA domain [Falsarthrobacter nasiphocae]
MTSHGKNVPDPVEAPLEDLLSGASAGDARAGGSGAGGPASVPGGGADDAGAAARKRRLSRRAVMTLVGAAGVAAVAASVGALRGAAPGPAEPMTETVPPVAGSTLEEAQAALRRAGLKYRTKESPSDSPRGSVLGTEPEAGKPADRGAAVRILVSSGPSHAKVPDRLDGLDEAEARRRLEDLGFTVTTSQQNSAKVSENKVMSVTPQPGTDVAVGTEVVLTVSSGRVTMPSLVGLKRADAIRRLEADDLRLPYEIRYAFTRGRSFGTVTEQSEKAHASIPAGTKIRLTITLDPRRTRPTTAPAPSSSPSSSKSPEPKRT